MKTQNDTLESLITSLNLGPVPDPRPPLGAENTSPGTGFTVQKVIFGKEMVKKR